MSGIRRNRDHFTLMGAFDRKYSDEQREAAERAYVPYKCTGNKVAELAASGQLKRPDGSCLDPFEISPHTVRKLWERRNAESLGQVDSPLADVEPRDAIEILRRRLLNVCDAELRKLERKPVGKRDLETVRQVARAAREAASIPGPKDPRPVKPGSRDNGHRTGAETHGGLAGSILHAARGGTVRNAPHRQREDGEDALEEKHGDVIADDARDEAHEQPGSRASDHAVPAQALA